MDRGSADRATVAAFLAIVILGGANAVGVRVSNLELAPLWGATLRFAVAAVVLIVVVGSLRLTLPRGAALVGSVVYGLLAFAGAFGFIYSGLVAVPAGVGQVMLALVPLLTFLFSVARGLERFRWQGLLGALIAIAGIGVVFQDRAAGEIPALSLLEVIAGAACMAGSNVVAKSFPRCHPVVHNAIAMGTAAVVLLAASIALGEPRVLPTRSATWIAVGYVAVIGSVVVFSLFLYVIARWTASASSYVMLLMPLVTVVVAALLAGEQVTSAYFVGGALVLGGVYVGAFAPSVASVVRRLGAAPPGAARASLPGGGEEVPPERPSPIVPGCA
jgi:O-acetylserine/cysteine efflux transporter